MGKILDLTEESERLKRVESKVDLIISMLKSEPPVPPVTELPIPPPTGDHITLEQFGGSPASVDNWEPFRKAIEEQQKNGLPIFLAPDSNYKILGYKRIDTPNPIEIYPIGSSLTIGIPNYDKYKDSGEDDYLFVLGKKPKVKILVDILGPEQWLGIQLHNRELFKCQQDVEEGEIIWIGNNVKQTTPSWAMRFMYSGTKGFVKVAQCNINHFGAGFQDFKTNNGPKLLSVVRNCTVVSNESNNISRWEIEGEFKDGKFYPDNFNLDYLKSYNWNEDFGIWFYSLQFGTGYLYFFKDNFNEDHITIPEQLNIGDLTEEGYVVDKRYNGRVGFERDFEYQFSKEYVAPTPIPGGKTKLFICFRKNNTTIADGIKGYGHPTLTTLSVGEMINKAFYNQPSMAADWWELLVDAFYRQSVRGEGTTYGYKLENVTGLEGQWDPELLVDEHTEPEILEFVAKIDALLSQ